MKKALVWDHIIEQRAALRATLAHFTEEQWNAPSLCSKWRVRDVAGHAISSPQITWGVTAILVPTMIRHGYNGAIERDGIRRGSVPIEELLRQWNTWATVRRGPVTTSHLEPLFDILIHTQDIYRPLGIDYDMPLEAVKAIMNRGWLLGKTMPGHQSNKQFRFRATDTDWERGNGKLILEAPLQEILMMVSGRQPRLDTVTGTGLSALTPSR